jgi:hypothetical protein
LDKWNDHKYMNINFKIQSQLNDKSNRRLQELGASGPGLSRFLSVVKKH